MPISIILDIVISVLLVLTIAYAVRLNQRLSQLRADKHELQHLADIFVEATQRAEAGIAQLKISSDGLHADITQAETLKDDLDYLVERGERIANVLVEETHPSPNGISKTTKTGGVGKPLPHAAPRREPDPEARLIEDAIRAATPQSSRGDEAQDAASMQRITGRITGLLAKENRGLSSSAGPSVGQASAGQGGNMVSRALYTGASSGASSRSNDDDDDDGIGDSEAARELLKALGTVK